MTAELSLDDARSTDPVERLLEDSWEGRSRHVSRRELIVESVAAAVFLCVAIPLAAHAFAAHHVDLELAAVLVCLYALVARLVAFPIGAGYVVPTYLVLVPMLLLLPPGTAPLFTAIGLVLGTLVEMVARRVPPERVLFAIPDGAHALGPAAVLLIAGHVHGGATLARVYVFAFLAGCLFDLVSATVRESAIQGIRPRLQVRVIALVWLVDACVAPLGLLVAHAARQNPAQILLILPLNILLLLLSRDRTARIEKAQHQLDLLAHERTRLQTAVGRLGDVLAAKLDLAALTDIVLRATVDALDAEAGRFTLAGDGEPRVVEAAASPRVTPALEAASGRASRDSAACQLERDGVWALALPFAVAGEGKNPVGAVVVARGERKFRDDERALMTGLVERAREAAADIIAHQRLRRQALTDALTMLGNRRKLAEDVDERLPRASSEKPLVLIVFDLDGFKSYNDTFGHPAGDALLARLGDKLSRGVAGHGTAYRLGGDEFCALLDAESGELYAVLSSATGALEEHGENFAVCASYGAVLLPQEATNLDFAMQLADERMYANKKGRAAGSTDHTRDVLMNIIQARQPALQAHSDRVARLARGVGRRLSMSGEELDELVRAAELHDIGKVGIPDAILGKPASLDEAEWEFMRQHTLLGERILNAAPALRPVAAVVRATHERFDGSGYPDRLAGEQIPLAARVIAACDAYEAMTTDRPYRSRLSHEEACAELRGEAGRQFDPQVVDLLLDVLEQADDRGAPDDPAVRVHGPA